jgi:hypothetical protein
MDAGWRGNGALASGEAEHTPVADAERHSYQFSKLQKQS